MLVVRAERLASDRRAPSTLLLDITLLVSAYCSGLAGNAFKGSLGISIRGYICLALLTACFIALKT